MTHSFRLLAMLAASRALLPAADATMQDILLRLERLEQENSKLRAEVQDLKSRVEGSPAPAASPPLEERVAVQEQRTEEQQQTKVESAQKVPVRLTGMLLFNAFSSGRNGAPSDFPTIAVGARGPMVIRGTMRQTTLGIEVDSPYRVAGAEAHGQVVVDFYGTYQDYYTPRLRTGFLDLQWPETGVRVGLEKPIVSPRNPSSLAQVIYPALWGAGNLWLWLPQARVEQKFSFAGNEIRAQIGVVQTNDQRTVAPNSTLTLQPRPGWEGRFAFVRRFGEDKAIEFAPGFHYSRTLVSGTSVPSQLFTADWRIAPSRMWELTGAFFGGRNAGPLGGLGQGIVVISPGLVRPVTTYGGWSQLMYRPLDRLRFHAMFGTQDDRDRDLPRGGIGRNLSWIINSMVQLSPNVLAGVEAQQIRTTYVGIGTRLVNRYDLALAYLF